MAVRVELRKALERDLRRALETESFDLYYQPQIDLRDGKIIAAEVLPHWRRPEHDEPVPPREFIPAADASGLMIPLGAWVVRTACAQAQAWRGEGLPPLTLAINISPAQCRSGQLAASVESGLQATGFVPQHLELEVGEDLLLEPEDQTCLEALRRLRAAGARIAIGHFGTGRSNLSRLRRLPVDTIKLDETFVTGLGRDPDAEAVARAIIAVGRALELRVVAEGVENEDQLAFLQAAGCAAAQGFYLGPPLPTHAFASFLRAATAASGP